MIEAFITLWLLSDRKTMWLIIYSIISFTGDNHPVGKLLIYSWEPFYLNVFTRIAAWISHDTWYDVCEITYPFLNVNGASFEV